MHKSMYLIKNIDVFAQLWTSGIPTLSSNICTKQAGGCIDDENENVRDGTLTHRQSKTFSHPKQRTIFYPK